MSVLNQYTVQFNTFGYKLTWFENNEVNVLFTEDFAKVAKVINRIKAAK